MHPADAILLVVDPHRSRFDMLGEVVRTGVVNNLEGLVKVAWLNAVPIILSLDPQGGAVLAEVSTSATAEYRHERQLAPQPDGTLSAARLLDDNMVRLLHSLGRKTIVIAGSTAKGALVAAARAIAHMGYHVHIAVDATTEERQQLSRDSILRISGSGIRLTSWVALLADMAALTGALPDGFDILRDNLDRYMFTESGLPHDPMSSADRSINMLGQVA